MLDDQVLNQGQPVEPNISLGWRAGLQDEFKEHDWAKKHGKVGDFFKDALSVKTERDALKTKMEQAIIKPTNQATPDEIKAYHKALGVPDNPEEYELSKMDGVEYDPKVVDWFKKTSHQLGFSKEQAAGMSQAFDGFVKGLEQEAETAKKAELSELEKKLKDEWGTNFDKNMEFVIRGWQKFANEDLDKFLTSTGIGRHPTFIKTLYQMGLAMGEDWSPQGKYPSATAKLPGMHYDMASLFK